jgi:hypothetical protein
LLLAAEVEREGGRWQGCREGPRCEKKERWLPVLKRRGSPRE